MANHWLREIRFGSATRGGISFYSKMLCWWMYYVLKYTDFVESLGGSGSYDPTDFTGVTYATGVGSINVSGTDKNFRDNTNSPFASGDVGKWILLVDPNNGENTGWYEVVTFVNADNITIDYRSGVAEYPVQNTSNNMDYYMMAEDNNSPNTPNDEWQLRTPHLDGWEIKFILIGNYYLRCVVALDTFAVGEKILQMAEPDWKHFGNTNSGTLANLYYNAYGTDDGSKLCIYLNTTNLTPAGANGIMMAKVLPFETLPPHSNDELWVLFGVDSAQSWNSESFVRGTDINNKLHGYVWRDADYSVNRCFALEWSYADFLNGWTYWTGNEANARTGKNDIKPGMTLMVDTNNSASKYEVMGTYPLCEMVRRNFNNMQTIDDAGTKDKLQIIDGFLIPWPGVTPQFLPT